MSLPRLVIAAPASGHGKTTVATGLMAALRRAGHTVSGHKVGPDYIDPGYHSLATGRPGRNLDPHLVGEERLVPLLLHGARGADLAIVEGVMGLHDGQIGGDGFASTAPAAGLSQCPYSKNGAGVATLSYFWVFRVSPPMLSCPALARGESRAVAQQESRTR